MSVISINHEELSKIATAKTLKEIDEAQNQIIGDRIREDRRERYYGRSDAPPNEYQKIQSMGGNYTSIFD